MTRTLALLLSLAASGCLERPVAEVEPSGNNVFVSQLDQGRIDQIDLLFAIDNSLSMADKQRILEDAVPDLVRRLVNPVCVVTDDVGTVLERHPAPAGPDDECAVGQREFPPVRDIHVGVVTSSLGGHGADSCTPAEGNSFNTTKNDAGRLLNRGTSSTDFLAWDPSAEIPGAISDPDVLERSFQDRVVSAGEDGCGFEGQLESWYRFLIDPEPYAELVKVPCAPDETEPRCVEQRGIDQVLLRQRREFLRPRSLVAVVMLSDENDCSVIDGGTSYLSLQSDGDTYRLPRATDECAADPDHRCCRSCAAGTPEGCPPPSSYASCNDGGGVHSRATDPLNLRCFDQKRRFGLSFLHPVSRYVKGLREAMVPNRAGVMVPNPLYSDADSGRATGRSSEDVILAGIVGVPWQLIATETSTDRELVYRHPSEVDWDALVGRCPGGEENGACSLEREPPTEPLMVESVAERSGVGPSGAAIQPVTAPAGANAINGHEWLPRDGADLQYACTFALPDAVLSGPDCAGADQTLNPLCQDPATGAYGTTQFAAKAFPTTRQLEVLKGYGENSIVASICARNLTDRDRQDFGYRPAIEALVEELKTGLIGRCLPRTLSVEADGNVPCAVVETKPISLDPSCDCSAAARAPARPELVAAVRVELEDRQFCQGQTCATDFCLCEVLPAGGTRADGQTSIDPADYAECQTATDPADGTDGWCYIDPEVTAADPAQQAAQSRIVANCPATGRRLLRFVGEGQAPAGATHFIACIGNSVHSP